MTDAQTTFTQHQVTASMRNDPDGLAIHLAQESPLDGQACAIALHPWQLRAICEHLGIVAADEQAAKTIAMLTRRLLALRHRIEVLADYLTNNSDHKHADLTFGMTYSNATAEIAGEYCADLQETPNHEEG